ncbi:MAG TPA: hypothetical protein VFM33_07535 [Aquabacterium sp.]|nr:hypothetical protein [Aquabacterium sp.]
MLKKLVLTTLVALSAISPAAQAQSAAKKELIGKLLTLQQPAIDAAARSITEQQPMQMAASARRLIMESVPEDKRMATAQAVDAELKKYVETAGPMIQASANKLATATMTPAIDEKFTEDELRTLVSILDSPVLKKYQSLLPELTDKLLDKIIADARPNVDPALNKAAANIRQILANATSNSAKSAPAKQPAKK